MLAAITTSRHLYLNSPPWAVSERFSEEMPSSTSFDSWKINMRYSFVRLNYSSYIQVDSWLFMYVFMYIVTGSW